MSYYNLDDHQRLVEKFREEFPDVIVGDVQWGTWYCHHYIIFKPKGYHNLIHYEYRILKHSRIGVLELHLEPDNEVWNQFKKIGIHLMHLTAEKNIDAFGRWDLPFGAFRLQRESIANVNDLVEAFRSLYNTIDPLLREISTASLDVKIDIPYEKQQLPHVTIGNAADEVAVDIMSLDKVMKLNLALPDYQREYCWDDRNITDLWNNLTKIEKGKPFHLGTIILHDYNGRYNIIDGQQRLITLTIMLLALGYQKYLPLLNESYESKEAQDHVANCKYIVRNLVQQTRNREVILEKIAADVSFAVLVVNEANLELAYTFFSNQNSKGVPLTDFDLLKAHHLRFVSNECQAEHMAVKWNRISQLPPIYHEKNALYRTIGTHVYRLRKWMRKNNSDENSYRYIQREYQAAPAMPDIPPFGEQFHFYEKIQGGTHFFVYVETFIQRYEEFVKIDLVKKIQNNLSWGPYEIFADSIETLLFGYYLKFGRQYLAEAFYCISQMMVLHRYNSDRVASDGSSVRQFAMKSELLLMIDQASSPTFFLAEAIEEIDRKFQKMRQEAISKNWEEPVNSGLDLPKASGVRWGIYLALKRIWHEMLPVISERSIRNKIIEVSITRSALA